MSSSSHEPQKSLQIKQDDKFFSRLLSKEASTANYSSRVYYGGASGTIPFVWESQPGTPKHPSSDTALPPLTPPPSYYSTFKSTMSMQTKNILGSKPNLLNSILPRRNPRNGHVAPSSSWSSSTSSSSSLSSASSSYASPSLFASMRQKLRRRGYFCSCAKSPPITYDDDDDQNVLGMEATSSSSPTSTLCFGGKRKSSSSSNGYGGRCCSMVKMKKALLSIVGVRHGSGQGTA